MKLKIDKIKLTENQKLLAKVTLSIVLIYIVIELLNEHAFFIIWPNRFVLNFILIAMIYLLFFVITNKLKFSIILSNALLFGFAFANYTVMSLRGTPLSLLDILSINTGLTIADTYTLIINGYLVVAIVAFIALMILNFKTDYNYKFNKNKKDIIIRICTVLCITVFCTLLIFTSFIKVFFLYTNLWIPSKEYKKNGFLVSFVKQINDLNIKQPKEYSNKKIKDIYYSVLEDIPVSAQENTEVVVDDEEKPNVIVIMNESFSDMSVHHSFRTNKEYMPYFYSIYNNTIHGTVHTSVYGGKTPNSEWEFLTNNSMAFYSYGSVPYQQFIRDHKYSLVSTLESQGYSSTAIHTWYKTGYRRSSVYPLFGFDEFISYDDVKDEVTLIRNYPSDLSTYKLLTKAFENRNTDKPFFNFTITMQNHSGYDYDKDDFKSTIHLLDIPNCPKVEQYLSLIKESDEALKYLINYFENVDEKTIILFFGDHQPPYIEQAFWDYLNQDKEDSLADDEKGYLTPYFIWANYELPEANVPDISLNYLNTLLLDVAGLDTTPYQDYLKDMRQEIPVITGHGYMDKAGTYHDFKEKNEYTTLINNYHILEYNNMFGGKKVYKNMFEIQKTDDK